MIATNEFSQAESSVINNRNIEYAHLSIKAGGALQVEVHIYRERNISESTEKYEIKATNREHKELQTRIFITSSVFSLWCSLTGVALS